MLTGNFPVDDRLTVINEWETEYNYFLLNTGQDTIYIGEEKTVTATNGLPLKAQDTKIWEEGHKLYAICTSGESSVLNVTKNPGNLFSPGAIASQIAITGIPPVDVYTAVLDTSYTIAAGGADSTMGLDVSRYASVSLGVVGTDAGAVLATDHLELQIVWSDTPSIDDLIIEKYILPSNGSIRLILPVAAPVLSIVVANNSASVGNNTVTVYTRGSYREKAKHAITTVDLTAFNTGVTTTDLDATHNLEKCVFTIPGVAATTYRYYPPYWPNPKRISVEARQRRPNPTTTTSQFGVIAAHSGELYSYRDLPPAAAGNSSFTMELAGSNVPLAFQIGQLGTVAFTFGARFSYEL